MSAETGAWMPMYWADYLADTLHLSTEEHGAYLLLIATYWRRGGPLPDDDRWLANVTKMSYRKWRSSCKNRVRALFDISDGVLTHKRVEKEILRSSIRLQSARAAGIASAITRGQRTDQRVTLTKEGKKERKRKKESPAPASPSPPPSASAPAPAPPSPRALAQSRQAKIKAQEESEVVQQKGKLRSELTSKERKAFDRKVAKLLPTTETAQEPHSQAARKQTPIPMTPEQREAGLVALAKGRTQE